MKSQIIILGRAISKKKKELEKVTAMEKKRNKIWVTRYRRFRKSAKALTQIKIHGTAKEKALHEIIISWDTETEELTKVRDKYRAEKLKLEAEIAELQVKLAMLKENEINELSKTDEIVENVFTLNESVVRASQDREEFVTRHVVKKLRDEKGNLRSQVSFTSSNGLRRVVAMVNQIQIIQSDLATEAQAEIDKFFDRFKQAEMDSTVKPLYELTKKLLVEKVKFKVGPDLYRFISMELHEDDFPELSRAQTLLRQSIRSEKTNSYIRIYERKDTRSKWEPVRQS